MAPETTVMLSEYDGCALLKAQFATYLAKKWRPRAKEERRRRRTIRTWVLFARPRTNNLFLQDLERLKKQAEETESYPPAVAAVVTDPDTTNPVVELPAFRGVSASYHSERSSNGQKARDLYFPKPFNGVARRVDWLRQGCTEAERSR